MPSTDVAPSLDSVRLHVALERLFGALRRGSQPPDISLTAASTLRSLDVNGPCRLTELAAREGVTQPAMTQLVSRLERARLAERTTDPADKRVVVVRITHAGQDLLARRRDARARLLADRLGGLSEAEQRFIAAALPALEKLGGLP